MMIDIWGDSILKGVVYDEAAGRYRLLENNSVARLSRLFGINFQNRSKFGLTAPRALRMVEASLGKSKAEYAAIELGGNDCDFTWGEISADPDGTYEPNTPLDRFAESIAAMIDRLRSVSIEPVLINLPPIDASRYFSWISRGLNAANILKWLGSLEQIYRHHEAYSLTLMDIAREKSAQIIDIRRPLLFGSRTLNFLCADGIHLNERGHELIAGCFADFIRGKLTPSPA